MYSGTLKLLFLDYLYILSFYKFNNLKWYLHEHFDTAWGLHFETRSSISGSHVFIFLYIWIKVPRDLYCHLKT